MSPPAVSKAEAHMVRDYPRLLRFVEGIRQTGYFKMGRPYMLNLRQRTLPEGYSYVDGKPQFNEKVPRMKEMFRLRIEEKLGQAEIGRRLKMDPHAIYERLHNPYYANKKLVNGEWVDDDHEALISFDHWKAAQLPIPGHNWDAAVRKRKDVKANDKKKILACLGSTEQFFSEIAKKTGLSKSTACKLLMELQKEGITEKNPPGRRKGKWRIKTRFSESC